MSEKMTIPEIVFRIPKGSLLVLHASFKACRNEGIAPRQMLEMLIDRLGPDGTLMLPTFTYCYADIWNPVAYNPAETPGIENGILSETFRKMPGVLRSGNPTYSVAVRGKYADILTRGSADDAGLGHGSSYENANKLGAKILLFHVGNDRNSMLHYAEVASGIPYNDIPFRACWGRDALTVHGRMKLNGEFPACSEGFSRFDDLFVREGFAERLGDDSFLIDSPPMVDYICKEIEKTPDLMLCRDFTCEPCTLRRKRLVGKGYREKMEYPSVRDFEGQG